MTTDELYPLTLEPVIAEQFWKHSANPSFHAEDMTPSELTAGTLWLATDSSRVAAGPQAGRSLNYLRQRWQADLVGSIIASTPDVPLPLELKLKYTGDSTLTVALTEDSLWYILTAEEGASINAGFQPGLNFSALRKECKSDPDRWAEFMTKYSVQENQGFNLPQMLPLLLGAGLTLAQIGPPARSLSAWPFDDSNTEALRLAEENRPLLWLNFTTLNPENSKIFQNSNLTVNLISTSELNALTAPETATFIWPLAGQGRIHTQGPAPTTRLQPGRVIMLPASLGHYAIESSGKITYLLIISH
ncbi:MAG: hypothetical protein AMR96_00725 [Candidatus Adiutrix intracellularis]|jgi:hypothetical protein|nr:MAG: hypothetical protein AMR96_00725 [Candidatus Adiutrix intracellularis]MDR2827240.1 hypothetical protein [Candidatus Adiutrix intracellularis]